MKRILLGIATIMVAMSTMAQQWDKDLNCFCVIAGRNATADGSVMMAHNEDDGGEQMLNLYVMPRTSEHNKYLWIEFPGSKVADHFLNEYGVACASDNCISREDREDFTDGGVLYEVRTLVGQKARSAREGVKLVGQLVEQRGYKGSRTYCIADPNEAWLCSLVKGRHWVAQRVPDDKVVCLPNNYIIDEVNLADTANFLGSPDLMSYARERGWWNPERDGRFSFRKAYARPDVFSLPRNICREMWAQEMLTGEVREYDPNTFPFAVTPNRKVTRQDLINIMQCHGLYSPHRPPQATNREWNHPTGICVDVTVVSAIFQLRADMPREVGCVMWVCPGRPCTEPYFPLYLGRSESPKGWHRFATAQEAIERHGEGKDLRKNYPDGKYWEMVDRWDSYARDWYNKTGDIKARRDRLQRKYDIQAINTERKAARYCRGTQVTNPTALEKLLNND